MGIVKNPFRRSIEVEERDQTPLSFYDYEQLISQFAYQGLNYTLPSATQEQSSGDFTSLSRVAYKTNGVVFACMLVRMQLFAEARFQFRQIRNGRPGDLFGNQDLLPLEKPWPGATTGDLLSKMIQYADIAGNAYAVPKSGGIRLLRPDWVKIIVGDPNDDEATVWDTDSEVLGYVYQVGGPGGSRSEFYLPEEVAHFAPIPDPEARFRGMSWLTPIIREVMADKAATDHKLKFFENGATPNLVVKLDTPDLEKFQKWIELFRENHDGAANAYKTLYLGAGADATVVGADLKQLDFKVTQGAGETRIAAAAGVPPVIVGLSEGLQAATYSNYGQARRRLSDGTMWPLWRNAAGSLARIVNVPDDAELWIDGRDIPFLREDSKDLADIKVQQSLSIKQLVEAGFTPDSAVLAITSDDLSRLAHSGLVSVQLLPPGTQANPPKPEPAASVPSKREERLEELHQQLVLYREQGLQRPVEVHNHMPEQQAAVVRFESDSISVNVDPPPPAEVNVTVEAAQAPHVEFGERSFVVDAPITVQPTQVDIAEGAFRSETTVEAPQITIEPAQVHVDAPVTVEPARFEMAEGAVRVDAPPPAEVTVHLNPELRADLTIDGAALEALRDQPATVINVAPTPVQIQNDVHVDPTPVNVNIAADGPESAEVTFKRNPDGTIKSAKIIEGGEQPSQ